MKNVVAGLLSDAAAPTLAACGGRDASSSDSASQDGMDRNDQRASVPAWEEIKIENGTILSCDFIDSGVLEVSAGGLNTGEPMVNLPPLYRMQICLNPVPSSNIRAELWLPTPEDWNGRFLGTGNGGGGGNIYYVPLQCGIRRGFATANTDLGTSPNVQEFTADSEQAVDFGSRATHVMAEVSKQIIEQFYQRPSDYSYFIGGSTGGHQGLAEAQLYPDDFDGIIAGSPGHNRTHLHAMYVWYQQIMSTGDNSQLFTQEDLERLTQAIVERYAEQSGGAPGDEFLTDPRMVTVEREFLENLGFSDKQVEVLLKAYAGPVNPRTGAQIFSPIVPGSERDFQPFFRPEMLAGNNWIFKWVFGGEFNNLAFDFDKDMDLVDEQLASIVNANNPDLSAFRDSGGKLILYAGSSDAGVPMYDTICYFENVVEQVGSMKGTQEFARLFIVPGLGHVSGGRGFIDIGQPEASSSGAVPQDAEHDILTALMAWVEDGRAPEKMVGTTYETDGENVRAQRPIYPYPLFPRYDRGNVNDPENYSPAEHARGTDRCSDSLYLRR